MKKILSILTALLLLCALTGASFAADYVPSVEQKAAPDLSGVTGSDGETYVAVVNDSAGGIVYNVPWGDLIVTPLSQSEDAKYADITEKLDSADTQLVEADTPAALTPGITAQLPSGYSPEQLVITDVFDVSAYGTCAEYLAVPGNTVTVGFVTTISPDKPLWVMHNISGDEWELMDFERDGNIVYVTFDSLSVVAFVTLYDVYSGDAEANDGDIAADAPKSPKTADMTRCYIICGAALVVSGVSLLIYAKRKKFC